MVPERDQPRGGLPPERGGAAAPPLSLAAFRLSGGQQLPGEGALRAVEEPSEGARLGRRLGALVLLAAALVACALGLHTRAFLVSRIQLSGLRQVTPAEVAVDLHLPLDTFIWQVRPWVLQRRLLRDPMIAGARVRVLWPHTLRIAIRERLPVALIEGPAGSWEVDRRDRLLRLLPSGTVHPWLQLDAAVPGLPADLPHIVGIALHQPTAGRRARGPGLAQVLAVADSLGTVGARVIRSITWMPEGYVRAVTRSGVVVNFGDGSRAAYKTGLLLGILRVAQQQRVELEAVDVSAPSTPAVRLRPSSRPLVLGPAQSLPLG